MSDTIREQLLHLLATKALAFGDFTLASGKKSDHYFNCKNVTRSPEGMHLIGNLLYTMIRKNWPETDAIGGLTMGADPICDAVSLISFQQNHSIETLIVRKETKEHGTQRRIEGNVEEVTRLIVIDDVVTTAGSTIKAIDAFQTIEHLRIDAVIALVDRNEGGRAALRERGFDLVSLFDKDELLAYARAHQATAMS